MIKNVGESGRVGNLTLGFGWVKKFRPMSTSEQACEDA